MQSVAEEIREHKARRAVEIAARHRAGASAYETCASLTMMMDGAIRAAFETLPSTPRERLTILALGGYGRGELCPHSDVDLMVLRPSAASGEENRGAELFLRLLWDAGMDVGHSVRSLEEVLALRGTALDAWASVLEGRVVAGNGEAAEGLWRRMGPGPEQSEDRWFIEGVFASQDALHERHGSSVKLLEPNVKRSAGGLRDLHAVFWLHRAHRPSVFTRLEPGHSALRSFFHQLLAERDIEEEDLGVVERALEFLLRVRHEMHYQRDSLHDTLEYSLQRTVAAGLGYGPADPLTGDARGVERFMREYYLHARAVHAFSLRLTAPYRERIEPVRRPDQAEESVRGLFYLHRDVCSLSRDCYRFASAAELFEAFVLAAEHDLDCDAHLRAVIGRSLDLITDEVRNDPEIAAAFRRILASGRVGATLRAMNDLDVLGAYLPEFGRLVAFFQHNVYHYFTADEHTIIAIENAERLRESTGVLREVFRLFRRKETLYCAILLHDIAKPDGVADHELTGVAVAEGVLRRLGMEEAMADVGFLIRNHLVMEQVAFRRNIHDPATIAEFASRFARPDQLDALYLLTYADLSAVNRNVWTEWKAIILQELYQRTAEVLRRQLQGEEIAEFHRARRDAAAEQVVESLRGTFAREEIERHLGGFQGDAYLSLFTEEEIAQHLAAVAAAVPASVRTVHAEGYTEVTVIGQDAPFALSRFCAVLSANDANIFDANIFTRDDGIIIDRFRVIDAGTGRELDPRVCEKVAEELVTVALGTVNIDRLFAEHRRKWRRKPKRLPNPNVRTGVEFEDAPRFTIIDVYAADSVGLLYRVTETISRLGLDITFAKIATRVDGIVDAFYVRDRAGEPLSDPDRREAVRAEILATLRAMAEEELR
jgi:[protein-PII] uridylyltransferase